jgi:hypothetical protein
MRARVDTVVLVESVNPWFVTLRGEMKPRGAVTSVTDDMPPGNR